MSDPTIVKLVSHTTFRINPPVLDLKFANGTTLTLSEDGIEGIGLEVSWYELLEFLNMHRLTFISGEFKPAPRTGDSSLDAHNDAIGFGVRRVLDLPRLWTKTACHHYELSFLCSRQTYGILWRVGSQP